jgi:hypothetical protein
MSSSSTTDQPEASDDLSQPLLGHTDHPYPGVVEIEPLYRWPDDYIKMDQGRLYVRPDFVPIFKEMKWTSLQAIMNADQVNVMRYKDDRQNGYVHLSDPNGKSIIRAFLKRHWVRRSKPNLLKRLLGKSGNHSPAFPYGLAEARAVGWCQEASVPTLDVIAAGGRTFENATQSSEYAQRPDLESESFFLSQDLAPAEQSQDFWRYRLGKPGTLRPEDQALRRTTLEALAQTARRFHQANMTHRDFYWCHFYIRLHENKRISAHLIDLQRVKRSPRKQLRWMLKDLGGIRFSIPTPFVSRKEICHWYACYLGDDSGPKQLGLLDHLWCGLIRIRAEFYRQKENRQDAERVRRRYE